MCFFPIGTPVSANNFLFADRVSANNFLFADTLSANNLFQFYNRKILCENFLTWNQMSPQQRVPIMNFIDAFS